MGAALPPSLACASSAFSETTPAPFHNPRTSPPQWTQTAARISSVAAEPHGPQIRAPVFVGLVNRSLSPLLNGSHFHFGFRHFPRLQFIDVFSCYHLIRWDRMADVLPPPPSTPWPCGDGPKDSSRIPRYKTNKTGYNTIPCPPPLFRAPGPPPSPRTRYPSHPFHTATLPAATPGVARRSFPHPLRCFGEGAVGCCPW